MSKNTLVEICLNTNNSANKKAENFFARAIETAFAEALNIKPEELGKNALLPPISLGVLKDTARGVCNMYIKIILGFEPVAGRVDFEKKLFASLTESFSESLLVGDIYLVYPQRIG